MILTTFLGVMWEVTKTGYIVTVTIIGRKYVDRWFTAKNVECYFKTAS